MMDKFEKQFEQLDVQTQVMDETMSASTTLTIPQVAHITRKLNHHKLFFKEFILMETFLQTVLNKIVLCVYSCCDKSFSTPNYLTL